MPEYAVKPDPPIRVDGRCALPGCRKKRQPERSRGYGGATAEFDPFCSSPCARAYHGTSLPSAYPQKAHNGVAGPA